MNAEKRSFTLGGFSSDVVFYDSVSPLNISNASLVVCDSNTEHIVESCGGAAHAHRLVLSPGESEKSMPVLESILHAGVEHGLSRGDTIVGIGGGVITDLVGFAASVYMRGCHLVLAPTSLLAMVDAAFGGKTGINFAGYKNMVGTFYPAAEVHVAPSVLASLPELEFHSGLGETIKNALLGDEGLVELLEREHGAIVARSPEVLSEVIRRGLLVKCRIVEQDLTETGVRAYLNLGHTFAHALESVAGFGVWTHGEAVAWGTVRAARLGEVLGITPTAYRERIERLFAGYGFRLHAEASHEKLIEAMWHDKKLKDGRLFFVVQSGVGQTQLVPVEAEILHKVLRD
ncbi:MAG: 3-dehydroquinate synthase [Spirochaeta sp.]|nr:3-dehydroquinate synthase [Spirochaeta sp.]